MYLLSNMINRLSSGYKKLKVSVNKISLTLLFLCYFSTGSNVEMYNIILLINIQYTYFISRLM